MNEMVKSIAPLGGEQDSLAVAPDLVDRFRAEQTRQGLSLSQAAEQSGIPKGTLQPWLNRDYKGRVENIDAKAEKWLLSLSTQERVRRTMPQAPQFLLTPSAQIFTSVFEFAQSTPDIGLITGNAGVGKTMSALAYQDATPNVWILTADTSMRTPAAVLKELSVLVNATETRGARMMANIIQRLRGTGGLLIVDESQNFTTEAIDLLRTIYDRAGVGIVFMGNEPLKGRVEGLGRDKSHAQIFSRIGIRKNRARPQVSDVAQILDGWGLTETGLRKMARFIASQAGGLRMMNKALRYALMLSGGDMHGLTETHLNRAWQELTGSELPSFAGGE